ncbi:hypothetical protein ACQPW3_26035 [Actinosynnema sp. CA-248983]
MAPAIGQVVDRGTYNDTLVHNLNVANVHTFQVVADGYDITVHNASSCGLPTIFRNAPRARGVYTIKYGNGDVDVGMSRNMHRRMHGHNKKGMLQGAVSVRFEVKARGDLRRLEQGRINQFRCAQANLRNKINSSTLYAARSRC